MVQEGAIQLYKSYTTGDIMLGAVGQLQFEVFKDRMEREYNSETIMTPMGSKIVRWIKEEDLDEKCPVRETSWRETVLIIHCSYSKMNLPCAGSKINIQMLN